MPGKFVDTLSEVSGGAQGDKDKENNASVPPRHDRVSILSISLKTVDKR